MRPLVVAFALVGLVLPAFVGCLSDSPSTAKESSTPITASAAAVTPRPVALSDSADVQGPFDKTWPFPVDAANFTTFKVHFALSGPAATPFVGAPDYSVVLRDAAGAVRAQTSSGGTVFVNPGTSAGIDWSPKTGDAIPFGNWSLAFHYGAGPVHYDMSVAVKY